MRRWPELAGGGMIGLSLNAQGAPPPMSWSSREGPERRLTPMAILWPCQLSVEAYAAAGKEVAVPRQRCPTCGSLMIFRSGYRRCVRSGAVFRIWVKRSQ